jgi:vacuolar-type H+-ATPase subunit C/Vma6
MTREQFNLTKMQAPYALYDDLIVSYSVALSNRRTKQNDLFDQSLERWFQRNVRCLIAEQNSDKCEMICHIISKMKTM